MMQANELRLGNLIYSPIEKEIVKLVAIEQGNRPITLGKMGTSSFSGFDCLEPIPLTEEWLIKFGFQIRDKKYSLNYGGESMRFAILENDIRNPFILYFHGRFGYNLNEGRRNGDYCIEYVHELQNLYFSLNKKELEGGEWRIVREDNINYIITDDLHLDRLNLEIENGIIVNVYKG